MKKTTALYAAMTVLFLSLVFPVVTSAQVSHGSILLNMAKSRMNYGDNNGTLKGHKEDVSGLQAGFSYQAGLTKHFSIAPEVYFLTKGGTVTRDNPLNGFNSTLKFRTVEMPVLVRLHAGRFYFNAGPYVSYIFRGKESSDHEATHAISFGKNQFRRFETGFQTGGGYEFRIKKRQMAVDVRYTSGLTSLSHSRDLYSRTLNISVIVLRSLKRNAS